MNDILKKYYNYQELIDNVTISGTQMPRFPNDVSMSVDWFTKLVAALGLTYRVYNLGTSFTDAIIKDLVNAVMTIVYNRHAEDFIVWVEPTANDFYDETIASNKAFSKLINVIDLTLPKYAPLLTQFAKYSDDPLAPITSTTTGRTRFNDTPQDDGDFNDEDHATNVSDSSSQTDVDVGSIMTRLGELFKNFESIILRWSNEFNSLFFKEEQL